MTPSGRAQARADFPGTLIPPYPSPEYRLWVRRMARWAYQYGPSLLDSHSVDLDPGF